MIIKYKSLKKDLLKSTQNLISYRLYNNSIVKIFLFLYPLSVAVLLTYYAFNGIFGKVQIIALITFLLSIILFIFYKKIASALIDTSHFIEEEITSSFSSEGICINQNSFPWDEIDFPEQDDSYIYISIIDYSYIVIITFIPKNQLTNDEIIKLNEIIEQYSYKENKQ